MKNEKYAENVAENVPCNIIADVDRRVVVVCMGSEAPYGMLPQGARDLAGALLSAAIHVETMSARKAGVSPGPAEPAEPAAPIAEPAAAARMMKMN